MIETERLARTRLFYLEEKAKREYIINTEWNKVLEMLSESERKEYDDILIKLKDY